MSKERDWWGHSVHTHGRNETDTETSEETTGNEHGLSSSGSLENDTKVEDNRAGEHKTVATTEFIGDRRSSQGTEEGTGRENRDDERLLGGSDLRGVGGSKLLLEVVHGQNTRDGTGVISVEDTTEGHEQADENGRPADSVSDRVHVESIIGRRTMPRRARPAASGERNPWWL